MQAERQKERPRALLVEDDPQLGPLIERVLAEIYDVTRVVDGEAGLRAGLDGDFDVMVIDRRLPTRDGVEIVERLRANRVVTPILMLTALGSLADKVSGLDAGANDYLVKPFDFDELLARLRALRRTFTGEGPPVGIGQWTFYPESRSIYSPYDGRIQLTVRESALLRLLAENPRRTFTRDHILHAVFHSDEQPGSGDPSAPTRRRCAALPGSSAPKSRSPPARSWSWPSGPPSCSCSTSCDRPNCRSSRGPGS